MLVFYHLDELAFIERLKDIHNIVQAYTNTQYPDLKLTVSIGGSYRNDIVANLIETCDDALYEAKQSENALIIK
jgi:putative two-component system response regulator